MQSQPISQEDFAKTLLVTSKQTGIKYKFEFLQFIKHLMLLFHVCSWALSLQIQPILLEVFAETLLLAIDKIHSVICFYVVKCNLKLSSLAPTPLCSNFLILLSKSKFRNKRSRADVIIAVHHPPTHPPPPTTTFKSQWNIDFHSH